MTEIHVHVADWAVASGDHVLVTIGLGSCVAVALYDETTRVGGLSHILLPAEELSHDRSNPGKFPQQVLPRLLCDMQRLGATAAGVRARIAGGASMFANLLAAGGINIGERNVGAVREVLRSLKIPVIGADTGGDYGRSVYFCLSDGRMEVRSMRRGTCVL